MAEKLYKSTALIGSMTFLSRVVGLIRDILCAQFFGAGLGYDAFLVSFRIPNLMRSLFAEGAFSQAFVPMFTECKIKQSHNQLQLFVNKVAGCLAIVSGLAVVLGIIFSDKVIRIFAPGFIHDGPRFLLAAAMLKIIFPYLFFISLTALGAGILNTYKRFWAPAFAPVLLNLCFIIFILFFRQYYQQPVLSLAYAVLFGGVLQLLLQLPFLARIKLIPKPNPQFRNPQVKKLLKKMLPAIFGVSVVQLNLLLGTIYASFLAIGSVSWLYYADRVVQFPLGVFGVALATVILPQLSQRALENSNTNYKKVLLWGVSLSVLIAVPASIGLFILAPNIIKLLFQYGYFIDNDTMQTAMALRAYSLGLTAFIFIKIGATAFYARGDIKTPVKVGLIAFIVNAILSLVLMQHYAHVGLAISVAVSSWVNALILLGALVRKKLLIWENKTNWLVGRVFLSALVMGYVLSELQPLFLLAQTVWARAGAVVIMISLAAGIYLLVLQLLRFKWSLLQEPL